ncbi:MAG TPA: class D sortase [Clostridia bacterium]
MSAFKVSMIVFSILLLITLLLGRYSEYTNDKSIQDNVIKYKNFIKEQRDTSCMDNQISAIKNTDQRDRKPIDQASILGEIIIPKISVDLVIRENANKENLDMGAAHILDTPLPWNSGNSFIAAHRHKTYGKLFNRLGEMEIGDLVTIITPNNTFNYMVYKIKLVAPENTEVFKILDGKRNLTLVTCAEKSTRRLLVFCKEIK